MGPPGGGFHLPTCWGGRELFPIHGEVPTEGREGAGGGGFSPPHLLGRSGRGPPGGGFHLPTCWGGRELFPIHGEVPTEGRGRGRRVRLSPPHLLGRSARRAGWGYGSAGNLPTCWGGRELFPIHGEV